MYISWGQYAPPTCEVWATLGYETFSLSWCKNTTASRCMTLLLPLLSRQAKPSELLISKAGQIWGLYNELHVCPTFCYSVWNGLLGLLHWNFLGGIVRHFANPNKWCHVFMVWLLLLLVSFSNTDIHCASIGSFFDDNSILTTMHHQGARLFWLNFKFICLSIKM